MKLGLITDIHEHVADLKLALAACDQQLTPWIGYLEVPLPPGGGHFQKGEVSDRDTSA
jgi:hypothetical protein